MSSYMTNFFPSGGKQDGTRPQTPKKSGTSNFVNPVSTPQGSPSKRTLPPGANELPTAFESMKLSTPTKLTTSSKLGTPSALDSPIKLGRPQSVATPLSPGKSNLKDVDDDTFEDLAGNGSVVSVIHKQVDKNLPKPYPVPSPRKKEREQNQENTPPALARDPRDPSSEPTYQRSHAALSRQELYQTRERASPTVKRFNTSRGLTPEERELLNKPNVKRLVNVTQLCKYHVVVLLFSCWC